MLVHFSCNRRKKRQTHVFIACLNTRKFPRKSFFSIHLVQGHRDLPDLAQVLTRTIRYPVDGIPILAGAGARLIVAPCRPEGKNSASSPVLRRSHRRSPCPDLRVHTNAFTVSLLEKKIVTFKHLTIKTKLIAG